MEPTICAQICRTVDFQKMRLSIENVKYPRKNDLGKVGVAADSPEASCSFPVHVWLWSDLYLGYHLATQDKK